MYVSYNTRLLESFRSFKTPNAEAVRVRWFNVRTLASNHLGGFRKTLPMLRQATLNETFRHTRRLESFRSFNPPNAEAGDVVTFRTRHSASNHWEG